MSSTRFKGKVVIVTGGGSGIGRSTCLLFAQEGASVVVADIAEEGGTETVKMIQDARGKAMFVKGDVTKSKDASRIVSSAVDKYGKVDILVNNAGGSKSGYTVVDLPEDRWDFLVDFNLKSQFLMSKYAIPEIAKAGGGAIVNVASGSGVYGQPANPAYSAAKGGVVVLTKSMAIDHASQKIRVNCVAPGGVLTPLMTRNLTPEAIEFVGKLNLIGRVAEPMELANAIVFLASDDASFINGQLLCVDGGKMG